MRIAAFLALLFTACASSKPQGPVVPEWDAIPAGVVSALCTRLQNDAVASGGTLTLIRTTQPLVTGGVLGALARGASRMRQVPAPTNRAIPIQSAGGECTWELADRVDPATQYDRMVVELSAPFANPFGHEAGLVARVSLGGEHPSLYYIPLAARGDQWSVGFVSVLAQ